MNWQSHHFEQSVEPWTGWRLLLGWTVAGVFSGLTLYGVCYGLARLARLV